MAVFETINTNLVLGKITITKINGSYFTLEAVYEGNTYEYVNWRCGGNGVVVTLKMVGGKKLIHIAKCDVIRLYKESNKVSA